MDWTHQGTDQSISRAGRHSYTAGAGADDRRYQREDRAGLARDRDHEERHGSYRSSASLDTTGLIGMLIGGAVGYALTTAMRGGQSHSDQIGRQRRGMLPGYSRTQSRSERHNGSGNRAGWSSKGSSDSVEMDETTDLIASNKVEGTAVYNRQGERLGDVYNFMVGKRTGQVAYAVMSFGGLLGMGQSYHPVPWNALTYDTDRGGYVIDADKNRLKDAPSYKAGEDPFARAGYGERVRDFWSAGLI
jgi:hypothetical protein